MAAVATLPSVSIAGIHRMPTKEDFKLSRAVHNSLPHPENQPEISADIIKMLGELFVRYNAQNAFGIHLLHSHLTAPEDTVLFGVSFSVTADTEACWTKPVPTSDVLSEPFHGHVFQLQANGTFVPYEFEKGKVNLAAANTAPAFFQELASLLHLHGLADLVALQLLDGSQENTSLEFQVGPQGTVMLDQKNVLGDENSRVTTGWSFKVGNVYTAKKNTHAVSIDSKPLPTILALKNALRDEGVIA